MATFDSAKDATMRMYDYGADGHYFSNSDRKKSVLPIIRSSTKRVGVENGGTSNRKYVTKLTFHHLSEHAAEADIFDDFPYTLLSVGKKLMTENFRFSPKKVPQSTQKRMF